MEVNLFEGGCMGHRNLFQMGQNVRIYQVPTIDKRSYTK